MATGPPDASLIPYLQPGHDPAAEQYLGPGDISSPIDGEDHRARSQGDPYRQLVLRQAPMHAKVALGKEKDRKPIDPPPILQLIDKKSEGRDGLYDSPYLFVTSSLVPENYDIHTRTPELPSNFLTGSLASSIHRLKDSMTTDGGFFVFGDLSVKKEGRFRLRFTMYERDSFPDSAAFCYVSELVTNVFTVHPPRRFPGMTESSFLTRAFSDQGVKLRLRKDARNVQSRKRGQQATDIPGNYGSERESKRQTPDQRPPFTNLAEQDMMQLGLSAASGGVVSNHMIPVMEPLMDQRHQQAEFPYADSSYYMPNFSVPPYT